MTRHRIRADHIYPPIPIRDCDWQAVYDDDEPNDDGYWFDICASAKCSLSSATSSARSKNPITGDVGC